MNKVRVQVALLLAAALCVALLIFKIAAGDSSRPPLMNITREQFDTALAQWNSRHVARYEEVVADRARVRLLVEVDGTQEHILSRESLDGTGFFQSTPEVFDTMTVGALFAKLDTALTTGQAEADRTWQEYGWAPHYAVRFDTALGYPASIDVEPAVRQGAGNIPVDSISWHTKIESVKIIK